MPKGDDHFVLWPHYFDAQRSRKDGRRVRESLAVRGPDAAWVEAAARKVGLEAERDEAARHPSAPHAKSGCVRVQRKGPKESVVDLVAARMREQQDGA